MGDTPANADSSGVDSAIEAATDERPFLQSTEIAHAFLHGIVRVRRQKTPQERAAYERQPHREAATKRRWSEYYDRKAKGLPPPTRDGHPRQCAARCARTGKRCLRYAAYNKPTCLAHHGHELQDGWRRTYGAGNLGGLPMAYSKYLGPTLQQKLDEFLKGSHPEQLQLYEEIALARTMLAEQLRVASIAFENPNTTVEAKNLASQIVIEGINHVADLCAKMSQIEERLDDKVSVRQISVFVEQITRLIFKRLGDTEEGNTLAKALSEDLKTQIKMPTAELKAIRIRVPGSTTGASPASSTPSPASPVVADK